METITINSTTTAKQLFEMPENNDKIELIKGKVIRMLPTGGKHGVIATRLGGILYFYVEQNNLGLVCAAATGFVLSRNPDTVRAPDASFIAKENIPKSGIPEEYWEIPPDLAVEVLSPSDRASEVMLKVTEYFQAGTRLVWIIDPKSETVTIYRSLKDIQVLSKQDELDGEDVVPGFHCPLDKIFM
jgi:Uma2 family endonuclease